MTTTTAPRYEVVGCNDEQTVCDHCGKQGLKRTVLLRHLDEGDIVRYGTTCAVRACAIPGVRTKSQLDRRMSEANAVNAASFYYVSQAAGVLTDPERLERNRQASASAPFREGPAPTTASEYASWADRYAQSATDLRMRGYAL